MKITHALFGHRIPGLGNLLGGGPPEFSFNLIAGSSESRKTTLVRNWEPLYPLALHTLGSAFLADAIVVQRYIEHESQFKRVISPSGYHPVSLREYAVKRPEETAHRREEAATLREQMIRRGC